MTDLHEELAEQDNIGGVEDTLPADDGRAAELALPEGVAVHDVGEAALAATVDVDEGFGELIERSETGAIHQDDKRLIESDATDVEAPAAVIGSEDSAADDFPTDGRGGGEDRHDVPVDNDHNGRPPNEPPDGGDIDNDMPDPDDEIERQEAMREAGKLIGNLGQFTHGPVGRPLLLGEDTQITDRIRTEVASSEREYAGLTDASDVGKFAIARRQIEDLDLDTEIEVATVREEVLPLEEELDEQRGTYHMPVARLFVFMQPGSLESPEVDEDEGLFSNSTADVSVWVYRNLRVDAYMMADPFDEEKGAQIASFFQRLGLEVAMPVSDETHRLGYDKHFQNLPAHTIRRINSFVRDQLL